MIDRLATDLKYRAVFLLLGVAMSLVVGVLTGSLGWAVLVVSIFIIAVGLCKSQHAKRD
jgi:hypothetical protein